MNGKNDSEAVSIDYDALREYCTDELYNTYVSQLETLKLKNGQNIMSDYQNLDMKITNITSENNVVSLIVYAEIRFIRDSCHRDLSPVPEKTAPACGTKAEKAFRKEQHQCLNSKA